MRYSIICLLLWAQAAVAFDESVLYGQWAAMQQQDGAPDRHFFLNVNADLSGALIRTRNGTTIERIFRREDADTREAYLELDLPGGETAILWAWKQNNGLRRVNGLLFEEGRQAPVRNMLPVPLEYLGPDHELQLDPTIREWMTRHSYRDTPPGE